MQIPQRRWQMYKYTCGVLSTPMDRKVYIERPLPRYLYIVKVGRPMQKGQARNTWEKM